MTVKFATILHPCQFTRAGLISHLPSGCKIFSTASIRQCQLHLLSSKESHFIVFSLQGVDYTAMDILTLINLLCTDNQQHRILMIMDVHREYGLMEYLRKLSNRIEFIDPQSSLLLFIQQINDCDFHKQFQEVEFEKKTPKSLSLRERQILEGILMEFNYKQIAQMLSISPKMVGHHKRQALRKLGAKSIQSLLLPTNQSFRITSKSCSLT